ncbi:MAG: Cl- channel voltage-gated family protein [Nitrospirae bacterium CG_4_9_14_0_8_um_filter_70_14]|nr:MAG: Cl- channel voltage-gated family protein [Nitrospirae bacterium CG_4_9_14_0_8_um_filter_70_14]
MLLARLLAIRPSDETQLILIAVVVGVLAALGYVLLRTSLEQVEAYFFGPLHSLLSIDLGGWRRVGIVLLPVLGIVCLIPLMLLFPGDVGGYGLPRFLEIVNLRGGVIRARSIFITIVAPALTIGSGGSAGLEGPIAQLGGAIGSNVGQTFGVTGTKMRVMVASGVAAGIAAVFNAPMAGVMFAIEIVLLGDFEIHHFTPLVIAAGVATASARMVFGNALMFDVPAYTLVSYWELLLYAGLGVVVGGLAVLNIKIFYGVWDLFESSRLPRLVRPVVGAALVGTVGIGLPQVMGGGYHTISEAMHGDLPWLLMAALPLFKMVTTAITLGSGGAGGIFAPAMFMGTMVGGAYGAMVHAIWPSATAPVGTYALVGLGAFLAAAAHAPLTAMFLLFEITNSHEIVLPVLFASAIGTIIARLFYAESIDTEALSRKGVELKVGRELTAMNALTVAEVMHKDFASVPASLDLHSLAQRFATSPWIYFPVLDHGERMVGIISLNDIRTVLVEEELAHLVVVADMMTREVITVFPDDTLNRAMEEFGRKDIEQMPVVARQDPGRVLGMLKRQDVIRAYNEQILGRAHGAYGAPMH